MHTPKRSSRSICVLFIILCFLFVSCGGGGGSSSSSDTAAGGSGSGYNPAGDTSSGSDGSEGSEASEVTLGWDPSPSSDVVGYLLYYKIGECGGEYDGTGADAGDSPIDVGNVTEFTVTGLMANQTYCFAVSAYNDKGAESAYSDPIRFYTSGSGASLPVAEAGPDQTVGEGVEVLLDAVNSWNPDGRAVTFQWAQTLGTSVALQDAQTDLARFETPDLGGGSEALVFQLTVTDQDGQRSTDTVIINVTGANSAPIADAGPDQTVSGSEQVSLDAGDSFDSDGTIESYRWVQTGGPAVSLANASSNMPSFVAPDTGAGSTALTFRLTVTDSAGLQASDECIVNVTAQNVPPVADAGQDLTAHSGESVTLDGSASMDSDDGITSYQWIQVAGPQVALSDASEINPSFIAPEIQADDAPLEFELIVKDGEGLLGSDRCAVTVIAN